MTIWFADPLKPPQFQSPLDQELSPQFPELPEKEFPFQDAEPLDKLLSPMETSTMSTEEDAWLELPVPLDAAVACCEAEAADDAADAAPDAAGRGPTNSGTITTEILWITVLHTVTVSTTTGSSGPSSLRSLFSFKVGYVDPTWKSDT